MREIEFTGTTLEDVQAQADAWASGQSNIKLIGQSPRSEGFGLQPDHTSWHLRLYYQAADDRDLQINTTQLLDIWRATDGAYIERKSDGDFFLMRRNGSTYLGPIPAEMIDDLEQANRVKREGSRYLSIG
jgi:hypothetical protein